MTEREVILSYAIQFIGLPYIWGGDDPIKGFDCSGLIHELIQAIGLEPRQVDSTAHGLYLGYKNERCIIEFGERQPADVVFWFRDGKAVHTGLLYNINPDIIIHAGRGGSQVTNADKAAVKNAYICMDSLYHRGENFKIADPYKQAYRVGGGG